MRDWLCRLLLIVGAAALLGGPGLQNRAGAASERILSFHSRIVVHPDASLTVTETITVNCAGRRIKRGIIREFPTSYRDRHGNTVKVGFQVKEVLRDGRPEPYHLRPAANGQKIYIGRKDLYLRPGVYTYTITYYTDRQIGYFKDFDELYWNVTGNGWTFPIERAEAVVVLPHGAEILQYAAYTGPFGAKRRDFRVSRDSTGNIVFTTTRGLAPGEGLTIAVAWPKGLVREPSGTEKLFYFFTDNATVLLGLIWLAVVLGYYLVIWGRVGRDPEKGPIIPLFEPPKGFSPAASRCLMRLGFDDKAFAAAVVDLAVKGVLTIEENNGDYTLKKKNSNEAGLFLGERRVARSLFSRQREAVEMTNKNHRLIRKAREALKDTLNRELTRIYFVTNSRYLIPGVVLTVLALGSLLLVAPARGEAAFAVLWLSIWSVGCYFLGLKVYRSWQGLRGGSLRILGTLGLTLFSLPFFGGLVLGTYLFTSSISLPAAVIILGLALVNALFFHLLKAPTLKGRKVLDQIEGFKMYLSVAEKERLEVLHPPEKTPELFEKYLPYALALDVENEWSEQFAEVLAAAQTEGRAYSPVWYRGGSWEGFRASRLAQNLSGAFTGAIASAASPPGSASGSGGGGFSGGGGGGGGGSGW
ncbi:MAG: DUF2207 domain-containing protein [Deltaproteobacteria bacterium]|nr:DUF2207 domain-containing protein [Deltaproteobacteria bacterium]